MHEQRAKKIPGGALANRDKYAFLLSHAKAPLREEKRDAATAHAMTTFFNSN